MSNDSMDPIWGRPSTVKGWDYGGAEVSDAWRAGGTFRLPAPILRLVENLDAGTKAKLSTWILDQNRDGVRFPLVTQAVIDLVQSKSRQPVTARYDRFFAYLNQISVQPGRLIDLDERVVNDVLSAFMECATGDELRGMLTLLVEDNLLQKVNSPLAGFGSFRPTSKAFQRLDEIRRQNEHSTQAFVAMWFDPTLTSVYADAIAPAIRDAGYIPFRVDQKEHSNRIDDEIVAGIRTSRFLIADFTCPIYSQNGGPQISSPRGGVYFEAGLAQGLGLDVIWTCREDCLEFLHFDTRQYSHIVWSNEDQLYVSLYNRIIAVVGLGPGQGGLWASRPQPAS